MERFFITIKRDYFEIASKVMIDLDSKEKAVEEAGNYYQSKIADFGFCYTDIIIIEDEDFNKIFEVKAIKLRDLFLRKALINFRHELNNMLTRYVGCNKDDYKNLIDNTVNDIKELFETGANK